MQVILERDIHDALKVRKPTTAKPILSENQDNIEKVLEQKSNETVGLDGNEWKVIRAYESILDEEKEKAEKIMHNLKKEQYRKLLNLQEKENNKLKNEATIKKPYGDPLEKDYAIQVNQDVKDFHEEELNKKKELLLKNKDELIVRKEQIVDQAKRREEEKRIQIEHDIENLKLANDKTAIELEKAALKKREARAALLKIELDNIENKKIRDAKKAEEAALDQKLMAEYSAKLDKEAFERENAFKKRLEGMAAFAQKYEDDGAGKALREAKIAEEKLLLKEQLAKADADLAKEVKKAEEIRLRALNSLTENDKLLKEKAARVEEQKRIDHLFAIKFKKDEEEFRTENKELKIKKKENQNKYRQVLDEQKHLKDSEVKISKNGMEAREKELNMSILKKAIDDPVILSKVLHRVRMTDGREKVRNAPKKTAL